MEKSIRTHELAFHTFQESLVMPRVASARFTPECV